MFRAERGLSLIETLVAVVMFALLALMIDAVFISAHRGARKAELTADVDQNARVALERLGREIRESTASTIDCDPGAATCPSGFPGSQVIFQSARPSDTSNSFCLNWESAGESLAQANLGCSADIWNALPVKGTYTPVWQRWIGYYLDAGVLKRVRSDSQPLLPLTENQPIDGYQVQPIASHIEDFDVVLSGDTVTIRLKARGEEVVQGSSVPPQEVLLESKVLIRNTPSP